MKPGFVFIFRQGHKILSEEEQKRRTEEVIALNFIQATDFDEAVNIAKTHPGLRYGVSIEVRPWTDPRAASAPKH